MMSFKDEGYFDDRPNGLTGTPQPNDEAELRTQLDAIIGDSEDFDAVLQLIKSHDRQLEQRVLEALGPNEVRRKEVPCECGHGKRLITGGNFSESALVRDKLRAELRTNLKQVFNKAKEDV